MKDKNSKPENKKRLSRHLPEKTFYELSNIIQLKIGVIFFGLVCLVLKTYNMLFPFKIRVILNVE